jgi:adenine-specific DNA-methyltransferase
MCAIRTSPATTRRLVRRSVLDGRSNLYLFFIEKCLRHLAPGGELVFITPRDFVKATSAVPLNRLLHAAGTITDFVDLGDSRLFDDATPNCAIWRFERDNFSRRTRYAAQGVADGLPVWPTAVGGTALCRERRAPAVYPRRLSDCTLPTLPSSRSARSPAPTTSMHSDAYGNRNFVCSSTVSSGQTRRMLWCEPGEPPPAVLVPHKERLIARRIRAFDETNWWQWGRGYHQSDAAAGLCEQQDAPRAALFRAPVPHYDGAVLAIFPVRRRSTCRPWQRR